MVSINTNLGAYSAQQSLQNASNLTTASTTRLSSGNRIDKASTDVAGLSVGTILATNVSTLRQGLQNAGQASSLLQVADGGLKNISDILQRQKALAVQATSGTLSDTERGYLDQEFQSLTNEINRTVANTKFSSVNLLDGSLSSQANATTSTKDAGAAGTTVSVANVATTTANIAAGDTITVGGLTLTFIATTATPTGANQVIIGNNATATASNIVRALNSSGDARLQNFYFTSAAANITADWGGGKIDTGATTGIAITTSTSNTTNITNTGTKNIAYTANAVDGEGKDRTFVVGQIGNAGGILAAGGTAAATTGDAILLNSLDRISTFYGALGGDNIGKFQAVYTANDAITVTLQVGNITYQGAIADTTPANATAVTFTGKDANGVSTGGTFTLNLAGGSPAGGTINSQADANLYVNAINNAFSGVTFVQNRDITSTIAGGNAVVNSTVVGNLAGLSANFRSDDFSNVQIGNFSVTAPGIGQSDAQLSLSINGEKYVSYSGIGSKIATNSVIAFRNVNDPNKSFSLVTGATDVNNAVKTGQQGTSLDLSTQANADAVAAQLNQAFGVTSGHATLNFQIGSTSSDAIGVTLQSASSSNLYGGATLDVKTADDANAASTVLDKAIQTVASLRADVGALQSRFTYASTELNTSIQNLDAARGTFLDTDVSSESTAYAQAQVKLQASISVLAQANQLPQNLLKLLG